MSCPDHITPEAYEWAEIFMDAHRGVEGDRELLALAFMELRPAPAGQFGLTMRQAEILAFLRCHKSPTGQGPTFEEIQIGCGLSSKSVVARAVQGLERRGFVRRMKNAHRSIALVGAA